MRNNLDLPITDFTDSITVKMFLREGQEEDATAASRKETSSRSRESRPSTSLTVS